MPRKPSESSISYQKFLNSLEVVDPAVNERGPAFAAERERILTFLRSRYAGAIPVMSRVDRNGVTYDYFKADDQPAARAHNLTPAKPPPSGFLGAGRAGSQLSAQDIDPDTAGLVPIKRLTAEDVERAGTLHQFLNKRGGRRRSILRAADAAAPGTTDPNHRWADAWVEIPNIGASSTLNIWRPPVAGNQAFSLSQIWCVAQGPNGRQTAEVGWHIYPAVTGHNQPAMFCYWTADGYATPTSYNGYNHDFVYTSATTVLGVPITDISVAGGSQYDAFCALQLYEGNWWLYIGGDQTDNAVGYFPGSLYNGGPLSSAASEVNFGGEVCGGPPFSPMGSGAFANAGQGLAAYQRNLGVRMVDGNLQNAVALQADEADPGAYTITTAKSDVWGDYFYYGGPGGS
jgi:hypothetical protein